MRGEAILFELSNGAFTFILIFVVVMLVAMKAMIWLLLCILAPAPRRAGRRPGRAPPQHLTVNVRSEAGQPIRSAAL
jgi:hypothetical protein